MPESVMDTIKSAWSESTAATDTQKTDAVDTATPAADEWDAPTDWAHEEREAFRAFAPEARKFALGKYNSVRDQYKDHEAFQSRYKPIDEFLTPRQAQFQQLGMTPAQAIQQLFQFNDQAGRDPGAFAKWFVQSRNLNAAELFGLQQQQQAQHDPNAYVDPEMAALRQELAQLKNGFSYTQQQIQERQRAEQAQRDAVWSKQIEDFRSAKGADGKPKAPYFSEVEAHMAALLRAGSARDLPDAYDQASYANPSVRAKVLADLKASERREAEKQERAHADKATKAAAPVASGSGSREGPSSQKTKKSNPSVMDSIREAAQELKAKREAA